MDQFGGYYYDDQQGGAKDGCHKGPKGRCNQYDGPNVDGCMKGPSGRCRSEKGLQRAYNVKRQASPAQLAALARGRATRAANAAARKRVQKGGYYEDQQGGYYEDQQGGAKDGCHMGPKGRCSQYDGPNADGCMKGPSGRCRSEKGLQHAYNVKKAPTAAQLAAAANARAVHALNVAARKGSPVAPRAPPAPRAPVAVRAPVIKTAVKNPRAKATGRLAEQFSAYCHAIAEEASCKATPACKWNKATGCGRNAGNKAGIDMMLRKRLANKITRAYTAGPRAAQGKQSWEPHVVQQGGYFW